MKVREYDRPTLDSRIKEKEKEDQHQNAGLVEQYKMKMNPPSTLKDFMSLMKRNNVGFTIKITRVVNPPLEF